MAKKTALKIWVLLTFGLFAFPSLVLPVFAADANNVPDAADATQCQSKQIGSSGKWATPSNCLFLEEPLDDKNLYYVSCSTITTGGKLSDDNSNSTTLCKTLPYTGGYIDPKTSRGPIQAILTRQGSKPEQGSFGLLYNYLHLLYTYLSGIVIGVSVMFVVVGGIQIATAGGESGGVESGKKRIQQAILGLILWFTASLILYTINPTFYSLS